MEANFLLDACAIFCAFSCFVLCRWWNKRRAKLPLPPGPRRVPVIGNVLDLRGELEWEVARKWSGKYGPVVYAEFFGSKFIFLNTYKSFVGLFEKRGANYSSRPSTTMADMEGWTNMITVAMPYGDELKQSRQMLHRYLQPSIVGEYLELQMRSTYKVLDGLLRTPDRYSELVRHSAGEMILMMAYGYRVEDQDDPYVELGEKSVAAFFQSQELFVVNAIPWLRYLPSWFPGTGFKEVAQEGRQNAVRFLTEPHEMVKKSMRDGTAVPSMSSKLIEANMEGDGTIVNEALIAKSAAVTYGGGSDTTVSAMLTFLLAMVLHPDVQQCAQEELDRVVGRNTLPTLVDRPRLPYIDAILKECLRWQPIFPLGVPRTVTNDDDYNGYHMPAGATVLANVWAITRNHEVYDKPEEFIPERWLTESGNEPPLDIYDMTFGFGRRICPGRYFADNSMFIGMASILATFDISMAHDAYGKPITPEVEYTTAFLRHPKPFKYEIKPRSKDIVLPIKEAVKSAE